MTKNLETINTWKLLLEICQLLICTVERLAGVSELQKLSVDLSITFFCQIYHLSFCSYTNLEVPKVHDGYEHGIGEKDSETNIVETEVNKSSWVRWAY